MNNVLYSISYLNLKFSHLGSTLPKMLTHAVQTSDDTGHGPGLNVYLSSVEHNSTAKKLYYSMVADNYKFAVQFRNLF